MKLENYKRLCKEHRDLTVRIEKLEKFLDSNIEHLVKDIAILMIEQYKVMLIYRYFLEARMDILHIDIIENDFSITYKFLGNIMPCKKELE